MKKNSVLLLFFVFVANLMAASQPLISGPTCVLPGVTYQYLISGQWDSASTMQICTTGAIILPINGPCTGSGSPLSSLLVTWNAGIKTGTINITSSKGNMSLTVTETNPLKAGTILTGSKLQSLLYQAVPSIIHCNPDTGGSCSPVYVHQWQQSLDNVNWTDISLATAGDLTIGPGQQQTIFFRRKTIETGSGSIAYSDAAAVMVGPPPAGTLTLSVTGANPN